MALKLNQVIALVGGKKTAVQKLLTGIHHGWKADRVMGLTRTYQPKNEDGEQFPSENKVLQLRVQDELERVQGELVDFWDLVATQEHSNTVAVGDIVVDGVTLVEKVPVSLLLFLEKQLVDLTTLVEKLPTLPIDKHWQRDQGNRCYVSPPEETVKTRKEQRPLVLYHATEQHPAQTQLISEDVTIGQWRTVHTSGAIPAAEQHEMLRRLTKLREAVKCAREQANAIDATPQHVAARLFAYIDL